jgi:Ca2+-binding EF-hand superfamily protein
MEKDIEDLFKEVDTDKSGYLESKEIKECLSKLGMILSEIELAAYVARFDTDGDGRISLKEFKIIMAEKL